MFYQSKFCQLLHLMCFSSFLGLRRGVMYSNTGNSAFSKQLEPGSIIVRHIKPICDLTLPLRVYGPTKSTHTALHEVFKTDLEVDFDILSDSNAYCSIEAHNISSRCESLGC
jgi:hypothetical protein